MTTFFLVLVIVLTVHTGFSCAQNFGNCEISGISNNQWQTSYVNDPINDNGTLNKVFPVTGSISLPGSSGNEYIQAFIDNNNLEIITTDAYLQYEENEPNSAAEKSIVISLAFLCSGADPSLLSFRQPITDLNNHYPTFSQPTYSIKLPMPLVANIDISQFGIDLTAIDIDITNTGIDFSIDSDDFTITMEGPIDALNKQFRGVIRTNKAIRFTESRTFTLTATDRGTNPGPLHTTATLVVEVDGENSYPEAPKFSEVYYTATYDGEGELHHIDVNGGGILLTSGYSNSHVDITGDHSENFEANILVDVVTVILSRNLPPTVLESQNTLILTLTVTLEGSDTAGNAALIIYLPSEECISDTTTATSTLTTTDCPICTTTTDETCTTVTTSLTDCSECPVTTTEIPSGPTTVPPDYPPNETTTTECPAVTTTVTDCSFCPTTTSIFTTTNCPELPTTTDASTDGGTTPAPTPPPVSITFTPNVYKTVIAPSFVGTIETVHADSSIEESVVYGFVQSEEYISIDESSGEITNSNYLSSGVHYLVVRATGSTSGASADANVIISVDSISVCDGEVKTAYSVLIKHIVEEQINLDIVTIANEDEAGFKYEIFDQYPTNGTDLFEINADTGSLQSALINREWPTILDMYVPQILVKLRMVNSTTKSRRKRSSKTDIFNLRADYEQDSKDWTYIDRDIQNVPNEVVVVVIVEDINDNAPVFDATDVVVGYPNKNFASEILPPYLTVVHATDLDAGYNASVYYTTTNDNVYVHPVTGVVYPTEELYDHDDSEFTVLATDRNGTGLSSDPLDIKVKLLGEDQVAVLTIENQVLEDVDYHLAKLSTSSGVRIKYLTASVIPQPSSSRQTRDASDHYLRLLAYGLDGENNPLSAESLRSLVADVDQNWTVELWNTSTGGGGNGNNSTVGFVVAVSILAVLLAVFIITAAIFYFIKFRHLKRYDNADDSKDISTVEAEVEAIRSVSQYEDTKPDGVFKGFTKNPNAMDSSKLQIDSPKRRLTGNILLAGGIPGETSSDVVDDEDEVYENGVITNERVESESEKSPSVVRERKKSVAFNDTVEKMEIEKEPQTSDVEL